LEFGNYPTIRASPNSQRRFLISVCSSMRQGIRLRYYKRSC
jgi:hypothetical protein